MKLIILQNSVAYITPMWHYSTVTWTNEIMWHRPADISQCCHEISSPLAKPWLAVSWQVICWAVCPGLYHVLWLAVFCSRSYVSHLLSLFCSLYIALLFVLSTQSNLTLITCFILFGLWSLILPAYLFLDSELRNCRGFLELCVRLFWSCH